MLISPVEMQHETVGLFFSPSWKVSNHSRDAAERHYFPFPTCRFSSLSRAAIPHLFHLKETARLKVRRPANYSKPHKKTHTHKKPHKTKHRKPKCCNHTHTHTRRRLGELQRQTRLVCLAVGAEASSSVSPRCAASHGAYAHNKRESTNRRAGIRKTLYISPGAIKNEQVFFSFFAETTFIVAQRVLSHGTATTGPGGLSKQAVQATYKTVYVRVWWIYRVREENLHAQKVSFFPSSIEVSVSINVTDFPCLQNVPLNERVPSRYSLAGVWRPGFWAHAARPRLRSMGLRSERIWRGLTVAKTGLSPAPEHLRDHLSDDADAPSRPASLNAINPWIPMQRD